MIIVLMGVAGSGKSAVGKRLAEELSCRFHDADDDHPPENVAKMRRGEPLTEGDRAPWAKRIGERISAWRREDADAVLACSALTPSVRDAIGAGVRYFHLVASEETLRRRLEERTSHFLPPELLKSQLETMAPPADAQRLDAEQTIESVVAQARRALQA